MGSEIAGETSTSSGIASAINSKPLHASSLSRTALTR